MIFVDSSFWIGLALKRDQRHSEAVALMRGLGQDRLTCTTLVRGETWTFLRKREGFGPAASFLDRLDRTARLKLVHPDDEVERDAVAWLRLRGERPYSHVDAVSFAVMRSFGVRRVLTFDEDFAVAGFEVLRA